MSGRALVWVGLALAALAVRCYKLGSQSLWSDEGVTVHMVARPLSELFSQVGSDVHPLLYYSVLHFWARLSLSEFWLRLPSALASWGTILVVVALIRRVSGHRVGLWTLALLSFSQFHILYAQEARAHAMLGLVASLSWALLWLWKEERGGLRVRLGWLGLALAMPHIHYLGFLVLGSQNLLMLLHRRYSGGRLQWLGWQLAALGAQLPWMLWVLPRQVGFARAAGYVSSPLSLESWFRSLYDWLFSHDFQRPGYDLLSFAPGAWGLCIVALALALVGTPKAPAGAWLWCWWLAPIAQTLALNALGIDLSGSKYFLYATLPMFVLLASGLDRLARWRSPWGTSLAAALMLGWLAANLTSWRNYHFHPAFGNQNWRLAGQFLRNNAAPDDLIIVQPLMMNAVLLYYLGPFPNFVGVNDPAQLQPPLQQQHYGRIWVCSVPSYQQPSVSNFLPGWVRQGQWPTQKHFPAQNLVIEAFVPATTRPPNAP